MTESELRHRCADLEEENRRLRDSINRLNRSAAMPSIERARERDEEFAEMWALVASQENNECIVLDVNIAFFDNRECLLVVERDDRHRGYRIRATTRTREGGAE